MIKYTRGFMAAAVLASAALTVSHADGQTSGLVEAGYENLHGGGVNVSDWNGSAAAMYSLEDSGINLQIGGGEQHLTASGASGDIWDINGNVFWRGDEGTFGASYGHFGANGSVAIGGLSFGASGSIESYGAFGESYLGDSVTLRYKGGGFSGSGINGGYAGAGLTFYPIPDLSLNATFNYTGISGGNTNAYRIDAEYLISHEFPLSISGGYEHVDISGVSASADVLMIRLRYRFGLAPSDSLVQLDRTGPVEWNGLISVL